MTSKLKIWIHISMLLAAITCCGAAFGQANFWSVFGYNGTGPTGTYTTCSPTNRFNCTIVPSTASLSGEPTLNDASPTPTQYRYQNAVYSSTGQLLFSRPCWCCHQHARPGHIASIRKPTPSIFSRNNWDIPPGNA
jgi:hypothetical protein